MNEKILDNVDQYSPEELAEFINKSIVSFDELIHDTDGGLSQEKRQKLEELLERSDENAWNNARNLRTVEALQEYLNSYPDGKFRSEARDLKDEIEKGCYVGINKDVADNVWNSIDKSDKEALRAFKNQYPDNFHVEEAEKLIEAILKEEIIGVGIDALITQINQISTDKTAVTQEQRDNKTIALIENFLNTKKVKKADLLNKLKDDRNILTSGVILRLINSGVLSVEELMGIDIDKRFIQMLFKGASTQKFEAPGKLDKIHKQSTEIYFWGIPSSGKSCALGAILSVAASGKIAYSMDADTESQGYGYMTKLINSFQNGEVGTLLEGTSVDSFYEMGFDLVDKEQKIHPITCIDMAGELMRCMYKSNAGFNLSEKELEMLDTLTKVLIDNRSTNRKMHFFVIEYGAENRLYEGLPQRTYLEGAVSYIKNTEIFKKDTDAIYIMITKADKAKNATPDTFTNYINDKYLGFYNGLELICKDNEINRGKVEKIAFSLGEVCFQNYCKFDSRAAENVVKIILQRSANFRGGKRGFLGRLFRG